jgi:hypothetical protein
VSTTSRPWSAFKQTHGLQATGQLNQDLTGRGVAVIDIGADPTRKVTVSAAQRFRHGQPLASVLILLDRPHDLIYPVNI